MKYFFLLLIPLVAFSQNANSKKVNCLTAKETDSTKINQNKMANHGKNVLGTDLEIAGIKPLTGFYRDGFCSTGAADRGVHVVAAVLTDAFLQYSKRQGNDLITPNLNFGFPGLKAGDVWCLCALRWKEAFDAGVAPPIILNATHAKALEFMTIEDLKSMAVKK